MFSRTALVSALLATGIIVAEATQSMHRPDNYKDAPNEFATEDNYKTTTISKRAGGKTNFAYFTNWGIYGADFQPTQIVDSDITHILYSFADTDASTGAVKLTDSYADEEKHFDGDSWDEAGTNLYGCLKQLYLRKLAKRDLKVLLSIGGWTYSQAGHFAFVTSEASRATFVSGAVQLVEDYGFDGIDIDFEYPGSAEEGQGFADLVKELRAAFDDLASSKGDETPYEITIAVSAGPKNYANLVFPQLDESLSYWNLMAYDYAGSWLDFVANQANVYGEELTGISTDLAIKDYVSNGVSIEKINLGLPIYGRSFASTDGLGSTYEGLGEGSIEAGIYSYKDLPLAGSEVFENTTDITSYAYDASTRLWVSYDTPAIIKLKSQYVLDNDLAGAMFWELSTDKTGEDSLVATAHAALGDLESSQNHINYPSSKWDNIKSNMGSA